MLITKLRTRVKMSPISRGQLGLLLGMTESTLSRIFSGSRPCPDKFFKRASAALDLLEQAHAEAEAARYRILSKWPELSTRYK